MQNFEWAENNLGVGSPQELQSRGVNVYFAPNVSPDTKVVDLGSGRVDFFQQEEERPQVGYYADFDDLERYCLETGTPLNEVDGLVSTQPVGTRTAGDPLRHEGL